MTTLYLTLLLVGLGHASTTPPATNTWSSSLWTDSVSGWLSGCGTSWVTATEWITTVWPTTESIRTWPTTEYTTGWNTPSWATPSWECVTDWMWSTSFGDGRTTEPTPSGPSPTSGGEYRCNGSGEIIPSNWLCDGMDDCELGDDEVDCGEGWTTEPTPDGEYRCNGSDYTIPSKWICDGMDDCELGDDEVDCGEGWTTEPTPDGEYRCNGSDYTIPSKWICDGMDDCELGDDEVDCGEGWTTEPTPDGEYRCNGSDYTIPSKWICDGMDDCELGDDEVDCGEGWTTEYPTFIPDETIEYYFHLISHYIWGFYVNMFKMY